ncbi:MAG: pro-sigmaK processing inhibitor BofA family protein [Methanofollis liminatans]|jgi:inhibitor of the pro-sigma K processing machinery|uniref:Pro-sigmaK processing inhibitor BofA family protein n=3 Tax=Methanofollis TaxID=81416 RepID=A0A7K4HQF7_9EURY|nr:MULTISPECIES: pro-sigmaK processing inhibitor BofA family protein [Methanofollis]EJG07998.1 sigmaK-factor processing regulatory BofA [Methanofollis liminatans DSM 4140]MDD3111439.1 pro-sigmaK processing inhibitor BofA family protein [Methanofollis liminatans]NVO67459.1 pro-sigmaK processing inhibitor BofA family protein [Methanofollis tationis]HDS63545.1 sigmaK-factor processing regulatory BofA [Methanofollis liminatans]
MIETIIAIALVIVAVGVLYYFFKQATTLIINAVVGLILLFLINYFQVTGMIGGTEIPINWATVLICALGGVIGVVLLVLLNLAGITI